MFDSHLRIAYASTGCPWLGRSRRPVRPTGLRGSVSPRPQCGPGVFSHRRRRRGWAIPIRTPAGTTNAVRALWSATPAPCEAPVESDGATPIIRHETAVRLRHLPAAQRRNCSAIALSATALTLALDLIRPAAPAALHARVDGDLAGLQRVQTRLRATGHGPRGAGLPASSAAWPRAIALATVGTLP